VGTGLLGAAVATAGLLGMVAWPVEARSAANRNIRA